MKVYIARHGQTDWNIQHRALGRSDVPLNETGRAQAKTLHDNIKDIQFAAVYASPLKRAAETAQIAFINAKAFLFEGMCLLCTFLFF